MSKNRDKVLDQAVTAKMLAEASTGASDLRSFPNWLLHSGGAGQIDFDLLWGATMLQLETHRLGVREHFRELSEEHGLEVVEKNGVYRLIVPVTY